MLIKEGGGRPRFVYFCRVWFVEEGERRIKKSRFVGEGERRIKKSRFGEKEK